jgi:hypothetical protein
MSGCLPILMAAQCAGITVRLRLLTGILNSNPASLIFCDAIFLFLSKGINIRIIG